MKKKKIDIEKEKIPHPYKIPENFFSEFKRDILELAENQQKQTSRILHLTKKVILYAAAIVFVFFAVKGVVFTFQGKTLANKILKSDAEIDAIYTQISEDDLTNFMVDESNVDLTEILDFKTN